MKRVLLIVALFLSPLCLLAQDAKDDSKKDVVKKPSRDFLMIQLTHERWMAPDSVNTTGIGRGFNMYLCYDFPINNSNFSFAAGLGIGTSNIYLDNQEIVLTDADSNAQARFISESKDYKKYKLTTAYVEAPFELRYFGNKYNRNKGFKAALGLRVGNLIGAHTKGKETGTKIVYKTGTKNFLETWRFAATARIGWGNITLMGTYNLNNLYKDGQGPEITPYSLGICITGL